MTDPPSDEDLTRVAPRFWSDDAMPLDAIVGGFKGVRNEAPIAQDPEVLRVAVFVDGTSDADTMGLADDVRMLLNAFVRDPASLSERDLPSPRWQTPILTDASRSPFMG